ncbi:GINS complex, PSF2 component [Auriculariales sp. MPI-PUGE-AT-0066]|nr:GINS complex, PSF2 component [Auriculariales sp. MPI-PUGE-AT-0066]
MSLPPSLRSTLSPQEVEFIAAEELIDIIPSLRMDPIRLISGVYGPFRPPARARVPLWLASDLKLKKRCRIVPPDWLTVDFLQERLQDEVSKEAFSDMPFRYIETSKVLLDVASDDLVEPDRIRSLLKDLREARQSKSRAGLSSLSDGLEQGYFQLPNISALEIAEIKPFFIKSLSILRKLEYSTSDDPDVGDTTDATYNDISNDYSMTADSIDYTRQ